MRYQEKIFKSAKKVNMRGENGSVTLFVVMSMLLFLTVVLSIYFNSINTKSNQSKAISNMQEQYNSGDLDDIYKDQKEKMPDTEAPTATITLSGYTVSGSVLGVNATIKSKDNKSGVDYENSKYVLTTSSNELGTDASLYTGGSLTGATTTFHNIKKAGTYYLHVLLADMNGNKREAVSSTSVEVAGKIDFAYTGAEQSISLPAGKYKLEVWGAEGGGVTYTTYFTGGKGGYSKGIIELDKNKTVYVYTGGKPTTYNNGGFNGGGSCTSGNSSYSNPGGGASDIRIGSNSIYSRVIVAGGGGGASNGSTGSSYAAVGGYGGGTSGGNGISNSYSAGRLGGGGTQTSGGQSGYWSGNTSGVSAGTFGQGGGSTASSYVAGGGGGWYGGGGANYCSAGGGSGWVYTESTFNAWQTGNSTDASKYELTSQYYLTSAKTKGGNASFVSPTGTAETGHTGNGYARISTVDGDEEEIIQPAMKVGEVANFNYTGNAQSMELTPGTYKLEVWGAQGGGQQVNNNTNLGIGGKGRIFCWYNNGIFRYNNVCLCWRTRKNIRYF